MANQFGPGVQLSPFDINPQFGMQLAAILQEAQRINIAKKQQAQATQSEGQNRALAVAQLLSSMGVTQNLPGILGQTGVNVPEDIGIPPSAAEEKQQVLRGMAPEQAELLKRVGLFGTVSALSPEKMQEAFEVQSQVRMTPFETQNIQIRRDELKAELERLGIEKTRAATENKRAGLDARTLQLQLGHLLAGSVPGIDPISGRKVSDEEFRAASDSISDLVSKGLPVPGSLWSKVLPVERAAALAKESSKVDPVVDVELDLFKGLAQIEKPSAQQKQFMTELVTDIWARISPPSEAEETPEAPRESILPKIKAFFGAALEKAGKTGLGRRVSSIIDSNVEGLLTVTGRRELRPLNGEAGKQLKPEDRAEIFRLLEELKQTPGSAENSASIELQLIEAAKDPAKFKEAAAKIQAYIEAERANP